MFKEIWQSFRQSEEQSVAVGLLSWEASYFASSTGEHAGQLDNTRYTLHPRSGLGNAIIYEKTLSASGEEQLRLILINTPSLAPYPVAKAYEIESLDGDIDLKRSGIKLTSEEANNITKRLQQIRSENLFIQKF